MIPLLGIPLSLILSIRHQLRSAVSLVAARVPSLDSRLTANALRQLTRMSCLLGMHLCPSCLPLSPEVSDMSRTSSGFCL